MSTSYQPPGGSAGPAPFLHRVRRSTTSRKLAGVCGGLGQALGIDPLVIRLAVAILTVFAGIGLLAYALAWLLVPEEGSAESLGQRLLHGRGDASAVVPIVGVVVGLIAFGHGVGNGATGVVVVVTLLALGIAVALSDDRPLPTPPPSPLPPDARGTDAYGRSAGTAYASAPDLTKPVSPLAGDWGAPPAGPGAPYTPAVPAPRAPRPPALPLGLLTVTAAVAVAAIALLVAHAVGASVGFSFVVGTALVVVGLGIAVAAVWGRAGALPVLGAFLAFVLLAHGAAADAVGSRKWGSWGDATVRPTTLADVRAPIQHGVGQFTVDLRSLPLSGQRVSVRVRMGVGDLQVLVPTDVALDVTARVRVGELRLPGGQPEDGGHLSEHIVDSTGASHGTLVLNVDQVIGSAEVQR